MLQKERFVNDLRQKLQFVDPIFTERQNEEPASKEVSEGDGHLPDLFRLQGSIPSAPVV